MKPQDTTIEAEYADGYILSETEHGDISPYNPTENILRAILNKDAEGEHGDMVKFSVFYKDKRYDIDWTQVPHNARPIRFRHGYMKFNTGSEPEQGWSGMQIGYQYTDEHGNNQQVIEDIQ